MTHPSTSFIHDGVNYDPQTGSTHPPIHQSAAFKHDSAKQLEDVFHGREFGHYYSRVSNPTIQALESRLTAIENGLGSCVVASGMAAITAAIFALAKAGDNIIVGESLFGSTHYLFTGLINDSGIEVRFVDPTKPEQVQAHIDTKTRLCFVEGIGNPKLDIPNIKQLVEVTKKQSIPVVVDTTFTTPFLCKFKQLGAAVLVYATTKYIAGGGTTIGGAVVDTGEMDWKQSKSSTVTQNKRYGQLAFLAAVKKIRSNAGSCQSPFNAYLTSLGLDTLALRMQQHSNSALKLAAFFESYSNSITVNYPGLNSHSQHRLAKEQFNTHFGGMLTIRVGSKKNAYRIIDKLKLVKNLVNLGDAKTLAVYPADTIYRHFSKAEKNAAGVYDDMIRISVGLEHIDDIIADFKQALEEVK